MVIAILAAISIVAYTGIQDRAKDSRIMSDIRQVNSLIQVYYAENGVYPSTGGISRVYTDSNCALATDSDGAKTQDWVPGLDSTLPQNPGLSGRGLSGSGGCYTYASDGERYVISAWNAKKSPDTDTMYRRLGWRETGWSYFSQNEYYCNHANIQNYYRYSYTISNITDCNET